MKRIIVYCEINKENNTLDDTAYELLTKARELKLSAKFVTDTTKANVKDTDYFVEAVAFGKTLNNNCVLKGIKAGADKVVLIKHEQAETFNHIDTAEAFVEYFNSNPSEIIIFPATLRGRIVAPRITTMLNCGLVADCTGIVPTLSEKPVPICDCRPYRHGQYSRPYHF